MNIEDMVIYYEKKYFILHLLVWRIFNYYFARSDYKIINK